MKFSNTVYKEYNEVCLQKENIIIINRIAYSFEM